MFCRVCICFLIITTGDRCPYNYTLYRILDLSNLEALVFTFLFFCFDLLFSLGICSIEQVLI